MATVVIQYDVKGEEQVVKQTQNLKNLNKENNLTQKETDQTNKKFKEQAKASDQSNQSLQGLGSQLTATANRVNVMGVGLGDLGAKLGQTVKGFKVATIASKGLSLAMKAIPVVALVAALTSLVSFFTKTQRGADALSRVMAGLGAVVDVVIDRASAFGETIVNAFSNPKESIIALGQFIIDNVLNRFKAIIDIAGAAGDAIKAGLRLDLEGVEEAAKKAGIALIQLTTGIDEDQQKEIANGFKSIAQEIEQESKAAFGLEKQLQAIERAEIKLIETRAQANRIVKEQNKIAEDVTKTLAEREAAAVKAIETEQSVLEEELRIARERASIIEQQKALGESLIEDERELAEERAKIFELETTSLELQTTLQNKLNIIRQQANQLLKDNTEATVENVETKAVAGEQEVSIAEVTEEQKKRAAEQGLQDFISIAGKQSAVGKSLATTETLINTFSGAQAAFKALAGIPVIGPGLATAAAAAATIAGLARVKAIVETKPPKFKEGGLISGLSHDYGGVPIEAEGGEFIMSRKAVDHWGVPVLDALNNMRSPSVSVTNDSKELARAIKSIPLNQISIDDKGLQVHVRKGNSIYSKKVMKYAL